MYDDPEAYFTDQTRKVTKLYKEHSLNQLKKEFRYLSACIITKVYTQNNGLFVPSVRDLRRFKGKDGKRKTRRPDHECPQPGTQKSLLKCPLKPQNYFCVAAEIDLNFLKEVMYSKREDEVNNYIKKMKERRDERVKEAREAGALIECQCCYSDECLEEDMLPCQV